MAWDQALGVAGACNALPKDEGLRRLTIRRPPFRTTRTHHDRPAGQTDPSRTTKPENQGGSRNGERGRVRVARQRSADGSTKSDRSQRHPAPRGEVNGTDTVHRSPPRDPRRDAPGGAEDLRPGREALPSRLAKAPEPSATGVAATRSIDIDAGAHERSHASDARSADIAPLDGRYR